MRRNIRNILLITLGVGVVVTSTAFASWFFGDLTTAKKEAIQNLRVDDIYENYDTILASTGGTKVSDNKYEIYIFPSAEYLKIYQDYLKDPAKNPKPEAFAGYLKPHLNSDGTVKKDTTGKPIYDVMNHDVVDYTSKTYKFANPNGGVNNLNYTFKADNYVKRVDAQRYDNNSTGLSHFHETTYVLPDSSGAYFTRPRRRNQPFDAMVGLTNNNYAKAMNTIYGSYYNRDKRPYGAPGDKAFVNNDINNAFTFTAGGYGSGQDGRKILYPVDRYGYWEDLTVEEGRFLPIKLTVMNSISPQVFYESYGRLNTSMQDGNSDPWFDLCFSGFTYVDFLNDPKGIMPLADLTKLLPGKATYHNDGPSLLHPEYYTIEQKMFPRDLFCTFNLNNVFDISNHLSRYADSDGVIRLFPTFSNAKGYWGQHINDPRLGGKDAVKTIETHTALNDPQNQTSFTHTPIYNNFTLTCNGVKTTVSTLQNIPICVNKSKTRLFIKIDRAAGNGAWNGKWYSVYDLNFDPNDPNSDFKLINGTGYYNLYFFIGDNGANNSSSKTINPYFDNHEYFKHELFDGKKLFHLPHPHQFADFPGHINEQGLNLPSTNTRPVYLMVQKATEPKVYLDLNPNASKEDLQKKVDRNFKSAPTGFHLVRPIYADNASGGLDKIYTNSKNNIYLIKSIDMTNVNSNYFQMRFSNIENTRIKFNLNGLPGDVYNSPLKEKIYVNKSFAGGGLLTKPQLETDGVIFRPAFGKGSGHFFEIDPAHPDFVKISEERNRGIYDVLLIYNPNIKATADFDAVFDVYVYRHTNIFIKIYTDNISKNITKTDTVTKDEGEFVDHYDSKEIWMRKYFIGDVLSATDKDDGPKKTKKSRGTLDGVLRKTIQADSRFTFDNLVVRDRVTSATICWYEKSGSDYVLKINPSFKVLKNYIFYLTTQ